MRLKSITVDNFKSLVGFKLDLAKFTCLIGLNGAGKSTVLQFIDFLGQQVRGNIDGWLDDRQWKASEVLSKLDSSKRTVSFTATVLEDDDSEIVWSGTFNPQLLHCTNESVHTTTATLEVESGRYTVDGNRKAPHDADFVISEKIPFKYQGSILSQLRPTILPGPLKRLREFFLKTESLDMLTPERLRQRTRSSEGSLGHGGRHLSAFVYELGSEGRSALSEELHKAYPHLSHVYSKSLRSGSKELFATEKFGKRRIKTDARHLNDGMLRFIAILAELASHHGFLLFDEIENGINPELIELLLDTLVKADQQIVVTTHSPMILNYLDDDIAKQGVTYIYKTRLGRTKAIPFFRIPSLAKKLTVMGPGEAFVDTNLPQLAKEIAGLNGEAK